MGKYNYKKSALKGLGYTKFLNEVKERTRIIESQEEEDVKFDFNANVLAAKLHPHMQHVVISDIKEYRDTKLFTFVPDKERGTEELAYFRAGQFIAAAMNIGTSFVSRPYSICSDPKNALNENGGFYQILVRNRPEGFAAPYIHENWKVGTRVIISAPLGEFYLQDLRDKHHIIAAAGGSGITPFMSMAKSIASGREPFKMTILYGVKTEEEILLREELEETAARSGGKVKVVYVLSDEEKEGMAHGFITRELILREAGEEAFSLFACGPQLMYDHLEKEAEAMNLPRRLVRFEVSAGSADIKEHPLYEKELTGRAFKLTILARGKEYTAVCKPDETLLSSVERAGIAVTSDCRSGQCGWCHSRLVSGDVFIPEETDGRRIADKTYGWIHPCVTYPKGDVTIEVFPVM